MKQNPVINPLQQKNAPNDWVAIETEHDSRCNEFGEIFSQQQKLAVVIVQFVVPEPYRAPGYTLATSQVCRNTEMIAYHIHMWFSHL